MLVTPLNRIHRRQGLLTSALLLSVALVTAPLYAQTATTPVSPLSSPIAPPPAVSPAPNAAPQGQGQPQSQDEPITTIKVQVNEVNLIFTVTDKKGRFITGLKRENFGLLDDGRPPEAVLGFTQQTNLPRRVG